MPSLTPEGPKDPLVAPHVEATPPPFVVDLPPEEEDLFFLEDTELGTAAEAFAHPFQASHPQAALASPARQTPSAASPPVSTPPPAPRRPRRRLSPWLLIAIVCVVLVLGTLLFNALLPATPPLHSATATTASGLPPTPSAPPALATSPAMPTPSASVVPQPTWVPQALPTGWTDADLGTSDALEAEQIAVTFAEREMSLDYRNMGTRTTHGGTMTASTAWLTPNAVQRFLHNDLRMMNNTLFDLVARTKLIRVAIGSSPQLLLFSTQGQQQFAWVDVSFQYWLSQANAQTSQRSEGMEVIAGTHLPRSHHLGILLLRVPPTAAQGASWLVSNYALDLPVGIVPDVVQPA